MLIALHIMLPFCGAVGLAYGGVACNGVAPWQRSARLYEEPRLLALEVLCGNSPEELKVRRMMIVEFIPTTRRCCLGHRSVVKYVRLNHM